MELWEKHRAYISRRFVVIEVIEVIMNDRFDRYDHDVLATSVPKFCQTTWSWVTAVTRSPVRLVL
jgi:hypothetical protein